MRELSIGNTEIPFRLAIRQEGEFVNAYFAPPATMDGATLVASARANRGSLSLTFTVYGAPAPKGSTKAFYVEALGRAVVTHDNKRTKPWQEAVVAAALEALGGAPVTEEPVILCVRFFLPRPKSTPKRVTLQAKKPDLDKLVRCVKDGLTRAGVYRDDAQVVTIVARKDFAAGVNDPLGPAGIPRAEVGVELAPGGALKPASDEQRSIPLDGAAEAQA